MSVLEPLSLLSKSPSQRSLSDCEELRRFLSSVPFFSQMCEAVWQQCNGYIHTKAYSAHSAIEAYRSQSICVVVRGSIAILLPRSDQSQVAKPNGKKADGKQERERLVEVRRLLPGDYFSEEPLPQDPDRQATAVAREDTTLAVISPSDFPTVAQIVADQDTLNKVEFFRSLPMFTGWSKSLLRKLTVYTRTCTYRRRDVIYREGETAKDVFFLVDGEVLVTKTIAVERESGNSRGRTQSPGKRERGSSVVVQTEGKVCYKQARELFGDEDSEGAMRSSTCTCVSKSATCYLISIHDFSKRIIHPGTIAFLSNKKKLQARWHANRLKSLRNAEEIKLNPPPEAEDTFSPPRKASTSPVRRFTLSESVSPQKSTQNEAVNAIFLTTDAFPSPAEVEEELHNLTTDAPANYETFTLRPIKALPELPLTSPRKQSLSPRNFFASPRAAVLAKYRNRDLIVKDYLNSTEATPPLRHQSPSLEVPIILPKILRKSRHNMFRMTRHK